MERAAAAGAGAGAEALDGAARRVSWGEEVKTFFPRVLNKSTFQFGAGLPFCYPFRLVWLEGGIEPHVCHLEGGTRAVQSHAYRVDRLAIRCRR